MNLLKLYPEFSASAHFFLWSGFIRTFVKISKVVLNLCCARCLAHDRHMV